MPSDFDSLLIDRVRRADPDAWGELIGRFEGRLLAFVESRLRNRATAEDVVQDTFIGFLNSLPNYDASRSLESYLFSIAAHKLTDYLRREGRRPAVPLVPTGSSQSEWDPASPNRGASSMMRSGERRRLEETALARAMGELIDRWREKGEWQKLQCAELLFVRGWANKDVAGRLGLSEQAVANYKFDFLARLRTLIRKQGLPVDVFPELN
jgi:RNA polymerase sigma-70 factor (ECF subfamily)